jgi:hypothetical protein
MKIHMFGTIALVTSLIGCAPLEWQKPGVSQGDFRRDSYECEKDARQSGYYGNGIAGALAMKEFYKKCMIARDYSLKGQ